MDLNQGIGIIFCFLMSLNCISLVLLRETGLSSYFSDTTLISGCLAFCALANFTGISYLYLGVFLYAFKLTNTDNLIKFILLFGGIGLGYVTGNNFYYNSSILTLALFTTVRLVESIIEMTLWIPEEDETKST